MSLDSSTVIGIFDSGVGGVTIWNEIHKLLPEVSTVYLADHKYAPYGRMSKKILLDRCLYLCRYLLEQYQVDIIVIACNTATTNTIATLRKHIGIPIIGVEPAIKPAFLRTKTNHIAVLATYNTLKGDLFLNTAKKFSTVERTDIDGTGIVDCIEKGNINSIELQKILQERLSFLALTNVDHLVLGCTHYPLLKDQIQLLLPDIRLIDSALAVARRTAFILKSISNSISGESGKYVFQDKEPTRIFITNKAYSISVLQFTIALFSRLETNIKVDVISF